MDEYLPNVYTEFRSAYPEVARALDELGAATSGAGPLDAKSTRLVKLGIAAGNLSDGAIRSNVRRALDAGATADEVRQVALLAVTTVGFPAAIAALSLMDEVLANR